MLAWHTLVSMHSRCCIVCVCVCVCVCACVCVRVCGVGCISWGGGLHLLTRGGYMCVDRGVFDGRRPSLAGSVWRRDGYFNVTYNDASCLCLCSRPSKAFSLPSKSLVAHTALMLYG